MAAVTAAMRTQVSQLYVAMFGRAPDADGLGYWVQQLANGKSIIDIAQDMYNTAPARVYYPLFLSNAEIVTSFYTNVLGRAPDTDGRNYWTTQLNSKSVGQVITDMINAVVAYNGTDAAALASKALFNNKVAVAQFYGESPLYGGVADATVALNGITATTNVSTDAAKAALIDLNIKTAHDVGPSFASGVLSVSAAENQIGVATVVATDPNNDPITYSLTGGADKAKFAINPTTGVITFLAAPDYEAPGSAAGTNSYDLQVTATAFGKTATQNVTVTVTNVNEAPVANASGAVGNEDTAIAGAVSGADPDGNALTYSVVTGPTNGTVVMNANGTYVYTPNANYNGPDSFTFRANDGQLNSAPATVSLTVNGVNDAPTAAPASSAAVEDGAVQSGNLKTAGFAADIDSPVLTFTTLVGAPGFTLAANGDWTFNPGAAAFQSLAAGQVAVYVATYQVSDGSLTATNTVTFTVTGTNDAPVASDLTVGGFENVVVTGQVVATDVDTGDVLTYAASNPTHGTVDMGADGSYTFTPDANYFGVATFQYTATDLSGASVTKTVTINLADVTNILTPLQDNITLANAAAETVLGQNGNLNAGDSVKGGMEDTVFLSIGAGGPNPANYAGFILDGIGTFKVTNDNVGVPAMFDMSSSTGVKTLVSENSTADIRFDYANANPDTDGDGYTEVNLQVLNLTNGVNVTLDVRNDDTLGLNEVNLLVTDSDDDGFDANAISITAQGTGPVDQVTPSGIERVNLTTGGAAGSTIRINDLNTPGSTQLFINADRQLTIGDVANNSALDTINPTGPFVNPLSGSLNLVDASASTGNVRLSTEASVGSTTILGGSGNDFFIAGATNDSLVGNAGNDTLWGGAGADTANGGEGSDVYVFAAGAERPFGDRIVDSGTSGTDVARFVSTTNGDTLFLNNFDSGLEEVEAASLTGSTAGTTNLNINAAGYLPNGLTIRGNNGDNVLTGTANDDVIFDNGGNDTVVAGFGNDRVVLGSGVDNISMGNGMDTVAGGNNVTAADTLDGGSDHDGGTIIGGLPAYFQDGFWRRGDSPSLAGRGDTLSLYGNSYAGGLAFNGNFTNFERLVLNDSNNDGVADATGDLFGYNITFMDVNASEQQFWNGLFWQDDADVDFIVDGSTLNSNQMLTFDASAESSAELSVLGGAASDWIITGAGNDTIRGGAGNDTINGGSGADFLMGEAGNDTFNINNNDLSIADTIDGGTGTNSITFLAGGQHEDDVDFTNITNVQIVNLANGVGSVLHIGSEAEEAGIVTINGGSGNDVVDASGEAMNLTGTQHVSGGGTGYLTAGLFIDGKGGNDAIAGGAGNDTIQGGTGNDALWGANGNDTFYLGSILGTGPVATTTNEYDSVWGGAGNDTVISYGNDEGVFNVTPARNELTDNTGVGLFLHTGFASPLAVNDPHADHLTRIMNDLLVGGTGTDELILRGDHTVYFSNALGGGFTGFEKITLDGTWTDWFHVTWGPQYPSDNYDLTFTDANVAAGQIFTIDGSSLMTRTFVFGGVTQFEHDTLRVDGSEELDGVFSVTGGAGNDTLIGGNGDDWIWGGLGKDYLDGGAGNDRFFFTILELRQGYDSIYGGTGFDTIELLDSGAVGDLDFVYVTDFRVIDSIESLQLANGADMATLGLYAQQAGIVSVHAGGGDDIVDARAYSTSISISGGTGNDTIFGGSSATVAGMVNTLFGNDGNDVLYTDTIRGADASLDHLGNLSGGNDNDTLFGARGNDTLHGGAGNDSLVGDDGDDFLTGDDNTGDNGADTMIGGEGNDTINANGGNDSVLAGGGNDVVNLSGVGNVYVDLGSGNDTVNGGATVTTGDTLIGGIGTDELRLTGNQTIVFNNNFTQFERIVLSNTFGNDVYSLTLDDANAAAGITFTIDGSEMVDDVTIFDNDRMFINASADFDAMFSITGGAFSDTVWGGALNDTISGGGSSDLIGGGAGADVLNGDAGNDTLYGGLGSDTMTGGTGSDTFVFVTAADSQALQLDHITDFSTAELDKIGLGFNFAFRGNVADFGLVQNAFLFYFGTGNATVVYDQAAKRIYIDRDDDGLLTNGDIVIQLDAAPNGANTLSAGDFTLYTGGLVISGTNGPDTLTGGLGPDTLMGGAGNDVINGGAGADFINGGLGNDTLNGDAGNDTIVMGGGVDVVNGGADDDTIDTGSNLLGGGIDLGASTIDGGTGNNTLIVHHNDTISGATITNIQTLVVANSTVTMTVAQHNGFTDIVDGDVATPDTIIFTTGGVVNADADIETYQLANFATTINGAGVAQTLLGGSAADSITGGAAGDSLVGGGGNDTITGGGGNDTMTGGAGADTFNVDANNDTVTDFENGVDTLNVTAGAFAILTGVLNANMVTNNNGVVVLNGTNGNDVITGTSGGTGFDSLSGGFGDDTFMGARNGDTINGGADTDTLKLSANYAPVADANLVGVENIDATASLVGLAINLSTQTEMLTVTGSTFADTITGGSGAEVFVASSGNDSTNAGGGDDTFMGANNNDTIDGGTGNNTLMLALGYAPVADANVVNVQNVVLTGPSGKVVNLSTQSEAFNITLSNAGDTVYGGQAVAGLGNTIQGGSGADSIVGGSTAVNGNYIHAGGGDDTILGYGGSWFDTVNGGDGNDTLQVDNTTSAGRLSNAFDSELLNVENITVLASAAAAVSLNLGAQTEGFNITVQNTGVFDDTITGAQGNDTIVNLSQGNDWIIGGDGNDTITSSVDGGDTLDGGNGNDSITGTAGALDTIYGGAGNDTIVGADAGDVIDGGADTDTLQILASYTPAADGNLINVENVVITGAGAINVDLSNQTEAFNVTGNASANVLTGGSANDTIDGGAGDDMIFGGNGDDVLTGGAGADTIDGGNGSDTVNLGSDGSPDVVVLDEANTGYDTINGFQVGNDKLDLTGVPLVYQELTSPFGGVDLSAGFAAGDIAEIHASIGQIADLTDTANDGLVEGLISFAIANTGLLAAGDHFKVVLYNTATLANPVVDAGIYDVTLNVVDGDLGTGDITVQLIGVVNDIGANTLTAANFM